MLMHRLSRTMVACLIVSFLLGYGIAANAGPILGVWYMNLDTSKENCAKRARAVMASERLRVIWSSNANDAFTGDTEGARVFVQCDKRGSRSSKATIVVTATEQRAYTYYWDTMLGGMKGGPLD